VALEALTDQGQVLVVGFQNSLEPWAGVVRSGDELFLLAGQSRHLLKTLAYLVQPCLERSLPPLGSDLEQLFLVSPVATDLLLYLLGELFSCHAFEHRLTCLVLIQLYLAPLELACLQDAPLEVALVRELRVF
jgi:hypothetical protein